jgi:hypothetical protein
VEHHGAERVGQRLLVLAGAEPGVPSWAQGGFLVQRLLLLLPGQGAERRVEARCGHEGLRTLLSSGHGAGVHNHVPLPRVAVSRPQCVGPAVGTSGGGGLAKRATTTSAAGVVLAVVAAAITSIAVFVVILGPVATGAVVAAMGRARRRGRRWLNRRGRNVGVERRRGSRRSGTVHVKLLQEQIIPNFEEVRKRRVASNDGAHVLEALVQPSKDVEDEDLVVNGCAEVSQTVGHDLELAAVLIEQEVTLNKSAKSNIKVKSTVLTVTEKLVLDDEPEVARHATAFPDHLVKIRRDGVADPVEDDAVHPNPPRISGRSIVRDVLE